MSDVKRAFSQKCGLKHASDEELRVDNQTVTQMAAEAQRRLSLGRSMSANQQILSLSTGGELLTGLVREKYVEYIEKLKSNSPRILLIGDTGLGKSNLVNIVFGFCPEKGGAEVRTGGRPCTQSFAEYGPSDFAPVRIIDSRGVEKLSVKEQMEELRSYISVANASPDELERIHLIWYFVGERWQNGDKFLVSELQKDCGVLLVLSKCDERSPQNIENILAAIKEDLPNIDVAECGDPRGTRNWIPTSCQDGHGEEWITVNLRRKTWRCECEIGPVLREEDTLTPLCSNHGDDSPFGHKELVHMSLELLPKFCRQSFLAAQRVDLNQKHLRAAAVIGGFTSSAAGVGYMPIPFADLPILIALEVSMSATLIAIYGVPFRGFESSELIGIHSGLIGIGGAIGYFSAQVLKGIPGLQAAGASVDMLVAGTAVMTLGISLSIVLASIIKLDSPNKKDVHHLVSLLSSKISVKSAIKSVLRRDENSDKAIAALIEKNVGGELEK